MNIFYKLFAQFYDFIDVLYFQDYAKSPRKALLDRISGNEKILDLCTGTATNAIEIAKVKTNVQIVGVDLSDDMLRVAKNKVIRAALTGKILNEAKRILKPHGEIIITEWEPSRRLLQKLLFLPVHCLEPKTYRDFIKKDLNRYFENYGLKIHRVKHCNYTKVIVLKNINMQRNSLRNGGYDEFYMHWR